MIVRRRTDLPRAFATCGRLGIREHGSLSFRVRVGHSGNAPVGAVRSSGPLKKLTPKRCLSQLARKGRKVASHPSLKSVRQLNRRVLPHGQPTVTAAPSATQDQGVVPSPGGPWPGWAARCGDLREIATLLDRKVPRAYPSVQKLQDLPEVHKAAGQEPDALSIQASRRVGRTTRSLDAQPPDRARAGPRLATSSGGRQTLDGIRPVGFVTRWYKNFGGTVVAFCHMDRPPAPKPYQRRRTRNCSGTSRWGMCPQSGTTTRAARGMS